MGALACTRSEGSCTQACEAVKILSERAEKWLRARAEKWLGSFYDGPEPPERFDVMVEEFVRIYPNATRFEWMRFAVSHAREAYRAGYVRGVEYVEREPDWRPDLPPEVLADHIDPNWKWRPMDPGGIGAVDGPIYDDAREEQQIQAEMKRTQDTRK